MQILSFIELLKLSWKNRKLLITIAAFTMVGASIISFYIPVYFKSTTIIFPVKLSQVPVNETALRRGNIMDFGETGEAEQTIEILNSLRLVDRIIEKYSLYDHYRIKRDGQFARTDILKKYFSNVDVKRNKFNTIQITVVDKKPQMAADMANSIVAYLDTIKFEIIQERAHNLIANLTIQSDKQQTVLDSIRQKMQDYTDNGVMSQFQRAYLIQAYAEAKPGEKSRLKDLVEINIKGGEEFDRLERVYEKEVETQLTINKYLVQAKADDEVMFSQKFIVERAEPAEKKSYPLRVVMVLVSVVSAMIISILLILFRIKWPILKEALQS